MDRWSWQGDFHPLYVSMRWQYVRPPLPTWSTQEGEVISLPRAKAPSIASCLDQSLLFPCRKADKIEVSTLRRFHGLTVLVARIDKWVDR